MAVAMAVAVVRLIPESKSLVFPICRVPHTRTKREHAGLLSPYSCTCHRWDLGEVCVM